MTKIDRITLRMLRVALTQPYKLSFGTVEGFDTLLVEIFLTDGRKGLGEATILTGYTDETLDQCWHAARETAAAIQGLEIRDVQPRLSALIKTNPFTATAFGSALEMAEDHAALRLVACTVPILGVINTLIASEVDAEIQALVSAGYKTLKVKVGWKVEEDLARVEAVQRAISGTGAKIRIDANQGYSTADGIFFAERLNPENVELFEQACNADDWGAAVAVKNAASSPIMLDEAIYDMSDVENAARLKAADIVKLKLMKLGSISLLEKAIDRTLSMGMNVVLGNGVATEIGCWMEACVAARRLPYTAGEMNGFLKQRIPTLKNPLAMERGSIIIPENYVPELDLDALAKLAVSTQNYQSAFVQV